LDGSQEWSAVSISISSTPTATTVCGTSCGPAVSHVRDFTRTWFEPGNVVALNRAARVVANSQATAQACLEAGVNPKALVTIYNPIDVGAFGAVSADVRARERKLMGIPCEALVIGLVGQVQPIKGHAEFVAAAVQVASQVPDVHVLIVGAPPPDDASLRFAETIRRQAGDSGFAERFHFMGFQADVPQVMSSLDVLVVPSWREPFGRVAVEGMAAGRAVIGTNVGGLPEIITDGVDGLLVPPRDPRALVTALLRLCEDAGLRERLAHQAARTAARYSIDSHVQHVQALYQSVLADRRGAA
jgi:glycosyltransferase involved in cell wall biosynthesis